jgi:predicted TIM-barrel fold metal-dependent hydrolase|tara:strand:- start:143 stop:967 length:825 start_codon:yes stop_codon:yes gene_type:complete
MIIDAHLHVWSDDFDRFPFAEGVETKGGAPVELLNQTMEQAGVDKAVIVQPAYYLYDNRYVAECLRRFPGKFAAIGLLDRHATDTPDQLQRLVEEDGYGGLRIHLSRPEDPAEWAAPDQDPIWQRAEKVGASFIVYGPAPLLPAVEPIIARFPGVKVVLDHMGCAPTDEDPPYPLQSIVLGMAKYPNVYVKFTPQLPTSKEPYPHPDAFPLFQRFYEAYGSKRVMWGTDFPHVLKAPGYVPALELFQTHMDFLTEDDKEWLFSKSALSVWKFAD